MSKLLILPLIGIAYLAGSVAPGSAPPDRDHDQLADGWEDRYAVSAANGDPDHDRLSNRREYRLRTNPHKRDTDTDGYNDRVELRADTNPRKASSRPFPNPATAGVPKGWTPERTRTTDLRVTRAGAVVEDVLFEDGADLLVDAPNVTIRRVEMQGGWINNFPGSACRNGLLIEDTTIEPPAGEKFDDLSGEGVVSYGGYTARGVEIWRRAEGFRVSGGSDGCGPVQIEDSFVKIVNPPGLEDGHSDGIQAYDGNRLSVVNTTIDFYEVQNGTAPYFVPEDQGNTTASVDRLLVMGGGAPFRQGVPGSIRGLKVVDDSWEYFPTDTNCAALNHWDARVVKITRDYQIARNVRRLTCGDT